MLIVDRNASYISIEFIRFAQEYKIVCLCLPAYSTHLLQARDVGVFSLLKLNYKMLLAEKTQFTTYKADFIFWIPKTLQYGITARNIQSAWRATGLIPYNLSVVFDKLSASNTDSGSLVPLSKHSFFEAKYHQHKGTENKSQR